MRRSTKSRWVVTAENCLTGERECVSLPMTRAQAVYTARMYIQRAALDGYRAYKALRIEDYQPKQLTLW